MSQVVQCAFTQVYCAYNPLLFKSVVTYSSLEEDIGELCFRFLLPACSDAGVSTVWKQCRKATLSVKHLKNPMCLLCAGDTAPVGSISLSSQCLCLTLDFNYICI